MPFDSNLCERDQRIAWGKMRRSLFAAAERKDYLSRGRARGYYKAKKQTTFRRCQRPPSDPLQGHEVSGNRPRFKRLVHRKTAHHPSGESEKNPPTHHTPRKHLRRISDLVYNIPVSFFASPPHHNAVKTAAPPCATYSSS